MHVKVAYKCNVCKILHVNLITCFSRFAFITLLFSIVHYRLVPAEVAAGKHEFHFPARAREHTVTPGGSL